MRESNGNPTADRGTSDEIEVVDPATIDPVEPVPGLLERTVLRTGDRRLLALCIDDESGSFGRRSTVYGWVRSGTGTVTCPGDDRPTELAAGDFLRVPSGASRRYGSGEIPLEILAVADGEAAPTETDGTTVDGEGPVSSVVGPDELVSTVGSAELTRETPFPDDGDVLQMRVRAEGGVAAGWHHHGENVYFGYAVDGPSETECGPTGAAVARIERGECFRVPAGLVHRDTNPTDEAHTGIVWLCGGEPWVVNVDDPASSASEPTGSR